RPLQMLLEVAVLGEPNELGRGPLGVRGMTPWIKPPDGCQKKRRHETEPGELGGTQSAAHADLGKRVFGAAPGDTPRHLHFLDFGCLSHISARSRWYFTDASSFS